MLVGIFYIYFFLHVYTCVQLFHILGYKNILGFEFSWAVIGLGKKSILVDFSVSTVPNKNLLPQWIFCFSLVKLAA